MPRRREVPKRKILQDPKYADVIVTKFMAVVMICLLYTSDAADE